MATIVSDKSASRIGAIEVEFFFRDALSLYFSYVIAKVPIR